MCKSFPTSPRLHQKYYYYYHQRYIYIYHIPPIVTINRCSTRVQVWIIVLYVCKTDEIKIKSNFECCWCFTCPSILLLPPFYVSRKCKRYVVSCSQGHYELGKLRNFLFRAEHMWLLQRLASREASPMVCTNQKKKKQFLIYLFLLFLVVWN